jgi:hypothetical protein
MAEETKAEQEKALPVLVMRQMVALATSGFGLVAALAWNNVIKEIVDNYIAKWIPGGGFLSLLIYALIVTVLAVLVTTNLTRTLQRLEQLEERFETKKKSK